MSNVTPGTLATSGSAKHGTTTSTGKNTIADGVVEKVAGIAAREVPGVHDLGNGAARAIGAIRNAINAQDRGQGISVEARSRSPPTSPSSPSTPSRCRSSPTASAPPSPRPSPRSSAWRSPR